MNDSVIYWVNMRITCIEKQEVNMAMPKPIEVEKLSQDVCNREIPKSEVGVSEADDYILHYCGRVFC